MNNGFIFSIIWFFEGNYAKSFYVEAITKVVEVGGFLIQLITFTYIQVAGTLLITKMFLHYLSDRLLLLEIARKLALAYDRIRNMHKKT